MMGCPQRLQGSVESGGRSPGINTLASHPGQVTIFKLPLVLMALSLCVRTGPTGSGFLYARHRRERRLPGLPASNFPRVNCFVTSRQSTTAPGAHSRTAVVTRTLIRRARKKTRGATKGSWLGLRVSKEAEEAGGGLTPAGGKPQKEQSVFSTLPTPSPPPPRLGPLFLGGLF